MTVDSIISRLPAETTDSERERIRRAHAFAARLHDGRRRHSGDPFITHPVAVAEIAADAGLDAQMICAALLHDVLSDADCDEADLNFEFGDEIASLVRGLTDLEALEPADLHTADERVLTLKLLDRLHNMQTLQYVDQQKQLTKSQETLELMTPLAVRLGLNHIADELETLARARLNTSPQGARASARALACATALLPRAARSRYLEEWLGELDALPTRKDRILFTWHVLVSVPHLALLLRNSTWIAALRWILSSNVRTWTPLLALLGWIIAETAKDDFGEAVVVLITLPPVLNAGVTWLRTRFVHQE
jgi:predicted HD phosphohydrolase